MPKYNLEELLARHSPEKNHGEVSWGQDVGREVVPIKPKKLSKRNHPHIFSNLFSTHFPTPEYIIDDNIEELNILCDVNELDQIRHYQSIHAREYDYEEDIRTYIR